MSFLRFFRSTTPDTLLGGRYRVIRQLGAGGFGQTFLAEDQHLPGHPHCVIKRLQPQFSDAQALLTAKRLFDTEAQVLYQLGSHSQIPRLLAHFEHEREFYLAQELIEGDSLSQELKGDRLWTEGEVVALLQDILNVLAFVHRQGVIHRDLKPANLIRRRQDGRIVLIDFGAVKQASLVAPPISSFSRTISIGTQGYMPSEQIAGNPRFSSDVYAVGMIGIQALTGVAPRFLEEDPQTGEKQWRQFAEAVNPELADFLDTMMRYDFRTRYPSAVEALEALSALPILPEPPLVASSLASSPLLFDAAAQTTTPWSGESPSLKLTQFHGSIDATALFSEVLPSDPPKTLIPEGSQLSGSRQPLAEEQPIPDETRPSASITPSNLQLRQSRLEQLKRSHRRHIALSAIGLVGFGLLVLVGKLVTAVSEGPAPAASIAQATPTTTNSSVSSAVPAPSAAGLIAEANQLRQKSQFQPALKLYQQAIALNPRSADALWGRCYSLNGLRKPAEAIAACNQALAVNPNYVKALWSKGHALEQLKRYQEALPLYDRAIALQPKFAEAWNNKGTALLQLRRPAEALVAFDKALALSPKMVEAWNNRGAAFWSLQRYDEAFASIDRALAIRPGYADALTLREQMRQRLRQ